MEATECIVCMEEITGQTGHTALGCGHKFHLACIVRWFATQSDDSTCPYCRHAVGEKDNLPIVGEEDDDDSEDDSEEDEDSEEELEPGMRLRFAHLLDDPNAHVYVDYEEELIDETSWDASGNLHSHWFRDPTSGVWNRTFQPLVIGKWNPSERPAVPITLYYHARELQRIWRGYKARQDTTMRQTAHILLGLAN